MAREMKDSGVAWIGEIPADWSLKRIKFLHNEEPDSFIDGDWIESPYITDFGIRYLTTGNVGDGMFKRQGTGYITDKTFKELNCKYAYPGDLVISRLNAPYGRACILPSDEEKYVLAVDIVILRTDENKTFLCYLTQCEGYQNVVQDGAKGTTMKRISRTNLGNVVLPIPPRTVQDTIVDFLNIKCAEIDSVLAKTRTSIEEYKKLKQAIITQAVTKGVRGDRPMKESGIGGIDKIPADWSVYKFSHIASVKCNLVPPQEYLDYPQVSPENIERGSGKLLPCKTVRDSGVISGNHLFFEGQILYSKIRPKLNKVCIAPFSGLCSADMYPIETGSNTKFIVYYMRSDAFLNQVAMITEDRVKMPKINQNELGEILVTVPSDKSEQAEIAEYLDQSCSKIDELISKKEQLAFELEAYKKSLIYEYVTGKKDVQQKQQTQELVVYPFFPAVFQATNPRFAQAILMSKVLDSCKVKMGRVKLEKMMFVLENSIGFDFDTEYVREAAGPLDKSIYECEQIISRRNKWFTIRKSQYGVSYKPTSEHSKYKKYYAQYFSDYEDAINKVISIFNDFDADQAEVIATLYGAWNDCIIDKRSYTDNDIVDEVLNHWHPKKRRFPEYMWLRAIQKMRELDLVPHGYGRHTVIKQN